MILDKEDEKIVQDILKKFVPTKKVIAFGSRVHGRNLKKFSDLDLAIYNINSDIEYLLKDEFSKSNLSIRVDVVDINSCSEGFKKIILSEYKVIQNEQS